MGVLGIWEVGEGGGAGAVLLLPAKRVAPLVYIYISSPKPALSIYRGLDYSLRIFCIGTNIV